MVGDILCTWTNGIGCEPLCERSLFASLIIQYELWIIFLLKIDSMFVFEMDRQVIDRWLLLVHGKFHHVPDTLGRTNVYMICYLIYMLSDSNSGTVMTLVYISMNILDGLDGGTDFDIDMTVVTCGQTGIIRDDIMIVKGMTLSIGINLTSSQTHLLQPTFELQTRCHRNQTQISNHDSMSKK
jgi:hypothetical protein